MRKIAANYVVTNSGAPIKNGYVKFNDDNVVVEVGFLYRKEEISKRSGEKQISRNHSTSNGTGL